MNKYLSNAITGVFIGIGISMVLTIWIQIEEFRRSNNDAPTHVELDESSVSIDSGRLVLYGLNPAITVNVKNNTDHKLETVRIRVEFFDKEGLYGDCSRRFEEFEPKEARAVSVDCHEFYATKIPDDTKIKVKVEYVDKLNVS